MIDLRNRIGRGALCALLVASATFTTTQSFALPAYDGLWSVSIVTEKGDCDRGYRYPIRIANGQLTNAGDAAFTITRQGRPDRRHYRHGERRRQERHRQRSSRRRDGRRFLDRRRLLGLLDRRAPRRLSRAAATVSRAGQHQRQCAGGSTPGSPVDAKLECFIRTAHGRAVHRSANRDYPSAASSSSAASRPLHRRESSPRSVRHSAGPPLRSWRRYRDWP